ncbi:MAG: ribonuclease III [Oscillospiraceae bacterium]|nr:ribonuclease III [Oscillospiraceae bacterium]MCR5306581.1 ribonuclease III [Oscillospiraceae bacterium]
MTARSQTELEEAVGYRFQEPALLTEALCHSSYANETRGALRCNERLEFLGDSVLSIVVSNHLFRNTRLPEGELTKIRASLVCEKSLFEWAKRISLGDYLLLGHGEEQSGGRERPSILADAFEAVIAAIFLDGGMEPAAKHILRFLPEQFDRPSEAFHDYKTALQEVIQQNPEERVEYVLTGAEGPDHMKLFTVEVRLNSNVIGTGTGRSKKIAEQMAAKEALLLMGESV